MKETFYFFRPTAVKVSDKVMIPQDLHPEINFVGLLIGPRGNTLKMMEKETGAKVTETLSPLPKKCNIRLG